MVAASCVWATGHAIADRCVGIVSRFRKQLQQQTIRLASAKYPHRRGFALIQRRRKFPLCRAAAVVSTTGMARRPVLMASPAFLGGPGLSLRYAGCCSSPRRGATTPSHERSHGIVATHEGASLLSRRGSAVPIRSATRAIPCQCYRCQVHVPGYARPNPQATRHFGFGRPSLEFRAASTRHTRSGEKPPLGLLGRCV
jgi:hypothetical protein